MKLKLLLLATLSVVLSGCFAPPPAVPVINWNNPIETKNRVQVEKDDFKKSIEYIGPQFASIDSAINIRTLKLLKNNEVYFQIYIATEYRADTWRNYHTAYSQDGEVLKFNKISKNVKCDKYGCYFYEDTGILITKEYLEKYIDKDFNFKLSGKSGDGIYSIPAGYIKGFLSAIPNN